MAGDFQGFANGAPEGGAPPADGNELEERRNGWRGFLKHVKEAMQDPVRGQILLELGTQLARDRQPGQSRTDQISRSISGANAAGANAQTQLLKESADAAKGKREEKMVDLKEQEINQHGELTRERMEADAANVDKKIGSDKEIANRREEAEKRRHQEILQSQHNATQRAIASQERQLKQASLNHEERMAASQRLHDLKMEEMRQSAELNGTKIDNDLLKTIVDASTDSITGVVNWNQVSEGFRKMLAERNGTAEDDPAPVQVEVPRVIDAMKKAIESKKLTPEQALERMQNQNIDPVQIQEIMAAVGGSSASYNRGQRKDRKEGKQATAVSMAEEFLEVGIPESPEEVATFIREGKSLLSKLRGAPSAVSQTLVSRLKNALLEASQKKRSHVDAGAEERDAFIGEAASNAPSLPTLK